MTILGGWREQFDRMERSLDRLVSYAEGKVFASSDEAKDALFHFFQDALHLGEWLFQDDQVNAVVTKVDIHGNGQGNLGLLKSVPELALCGDLANGTKHLRLTKTPKTGDRTTAFTGQSVVVRPGAVVARASVGGAGQAESIPPSPALHSWTVESNGQQQDALDLARRVVAEWQTFLHAKGLLT